MRRRSPIALLFVLPACGSYGTSGPSPGPVSQPYMSDLPDAIPVGPSEDASEDVPSTPPPTACSGSPIGCSEFKDSGSCGQVPGCTWSGFCSGDSTACSELDETTCEQEPGCWLTEAGAPAMSPFVGTWESSAQTISSTCFGSVTLDAMTFQISQLGPGFITLDAYPTSNAFAEDTWTVLNVSGDTATTPPLSAMNDAPCLEIGSNCTMTLTANVDSEGNPSWLALQIDAKYTGSLNNNTCEDSGTLNLDRE